MKALRRAFPEVGRDAIRQFHARRVASNRRQRLLRAVYKAAKELKVGVGGPDLLPHRPGQLKSSYPLIREAAGVVPTGIAVQDGNLEDVNPKNGKRVTVDELFGFATDYLKVDYIFWGIQEPYYSET